MARLQIIVPDELAREWHHAARGMGMPIGAWIRLQVARKPAAADHPAQGRIRAAEPLRVRIYAAIGNDALKKSGVAPLAARLGVPIGSVNASLGSMVASKRLVRINDEYRLVTKEGQGNG